LFSKCGYKKTCIKESRCKRKMVMMIDDDDDDDVAVNSDVGRR
jgi:hypothetical protein